MGMWAEKGQAVHGDGEEGQRDCARLFLKWRVKQGHRGRARYDVKLRTGSKEEWNKQSSSLIYV